MIADSKLEIKSRFYMELAAFRVKLYRLLLTINKSEAF